MAALYAITYGWSSFVRSLHELTGCGQAEKRAIMRQSVDLGIEDTLSAE